MLLSGSSSLRSPPLPALPGASSHHSPVTSHALQAVKLIENVQSLILTGLTVKVDKAEQTALWEVLSCFPSRSLTAPLLTSTVASTFRCTPWLLKPSFSPESAPEVHTSGASCLLRVPSSSPFVRHSLNASSPHPVTHRGEARRRPLGDPRRKCRISPQHRLPFRPPSSQQPQARCTAFSASCFLFLSISTTILLSLLR